MAFSSSKDVDITIGNYRGVVIDCNFAGVTGAEIKTGLASVKFAVYVPATSDDHGITYLNYSDAGSTVLGGSVYVDGVTSNDTGKLLVIGA